MYLLTLFFLYLNKVLRIYSVKVDRVVFMKIIFTVSGSNII